MIPRDIDPSLHSAEPDLLGLDDGFSPPRSHDDTPASSAEDPACSLKDALAIKSDF